ncbi:unnamed protein product [Leptidea sinapis]|uniref:Uncharacterized protein n=1 Tax=Leptidea sinapis TaxID=189913 RepID=A0A5E4QVC8_9NEOP|nr:unnamed protein product [Leptidea sinapis]
MLITNVALNTALSLAVQLTNRHSTQRFCKFVVITLVRNQLNEKRPQPSKFFYCNGANTVGTEADWRQRKHKRHPKPWDHDKE